MDLQSWSEPFGKEENLMPLRQAGRSRSVPDRVQSVRGLVAILTTKPRLPLYILC